jgi:hypothetical protein
MFISPPGGMPLEAMDPWCYLALRAVAPVGVFTSAAKTAFLKEVVNDAELSAIAEYTFQIDDYIFAKKSPLQLQPQLIALQQLAYRSGIRPVDLRVRNL